MNYHGKTIFEITEIVHDWMSNTIYLIKENLVTKVDLITWKSHPLGGNLFTKNQKRPQGQQLSINLKQQMREEWEVMWMKHGMHLYRN